MSKTISRLYGSQRNAMSAAAELSRYGYFADNVHVVGPPEKPSSGTPVTAAGDDPIVAAIKKGLVPRAAAKLYAEGVRRGGSLVTVHAPLGTALLATEILNRFRPIEPVIGDPVHPFRFWDDAAPFSSLLQFRPLSGNPTPFATVWNVPTLTRGRASLSEAISMAELMRAPAARPGPPKPLRPPFFCSRLFGLPMLSDSGAPLSSLLKMPVLRP